MVKYRIISNSFQLFFTPVTGHPLRCIRSKKSSISGQYRLISRRNFVFHIEMDLHDMLQACAKQPASNTTIQLATSTLLGTTSVPANTRTCFYATTVRVRPAVIHHPGRDSFWSGTQWKTQSMVSKTRNWLKTGWTLTGIVATPVCSKRNGCKNEASWTILRTRNEAILSGGSIPFCGMPTMAAKWRPLNSMT